MLSSLSLVQALLPIAMLAGCVVSMMRSGSVIEEEERGLMRSMSWPGNVL